MANPEHLAILKQGVEQWNKWRRANSGIQPDLSGADLGELGVVKGDAGASGLRPSGTYFAKVEYRKVWRVKLTGVDFSRTNLRSADLIMVDLDRANLNEASCTGTDLRRSNLSASDLAKAGLIGTNLGGANLSSASLKEALLIEANLAGTELNNADFRGARVGATNFCDVDLSTAAGLQHALHIGPCSIGIDTIYKSHGKIPEVFLRGCGVPDEVIDLARRIGIYAIEFYSCFISYSTKDQEFADKLYADLQNKGVRCWFAPHDIHGGRKIHEQLDEAIRVHDKLLLILSDDSMNSDWVGTEIAQAREREAREKKQMLFPISLAPFEKVRSWKLFDAERGKDSAREIREYFIPDFSNWKDHDSYQKALQRLVGDLKAEASG